jgi:hypothetical protein
MTLDTQEKNCSSGIEKQSLGRIAKLTFPVRIAFPQVPCFAILAVNQLPDLA